MVTISNEFPTNVFVASLSPDLRSEMPQEHVSDIRIPVARTELVTSAVACELLGVTANNLRQMVFKKLITPAGKQGRMTLFRSSEVVALRDKRTK